MAEAALEELREEFNEYRLNKTENDKILFEQLDHTTEKLNESRYTFL